MALVVNTNVASINAQRSLNGTQNRLGRVFAQLSSGMRITSAADDAAGLAISETLKSQVRSFAQAERNASDGISMTQVAEGGLEQMGSLLQRMRELAVQAANGTVDSTSRGYINSEFGALRSEIDRISAVTKFNGTNLLNAAATTDLQVGILSGSNEVIAVALSQVDSTTIGSNGTSTQFLSAASLSTQAVAQAALATLDDAIGQISSSRARMGWLQNRLETTITNLSTSRENMSAANSRIRDVDVAAATAELTKNQILSQAGIAVLAQANQLPSAALSLLR